MATKLIIGIGNPDQEYQNTRHNIGFMALDKLAKKFDFDSFEIDKKTGSHTSKGAIDGKKAILAKPQTYVNKSGQAVSELAKIYKVKHKDILIIQDDLDIEFGRTKYSYGKNSGGHKGIESIIKTLKTNEFHRVRIGIGTRSLDKARQQSDKNRDAFVQKHVLSKFTAKEEDTLKAVFKEVIEKTINAIR